MNASIGVAKRPILFGADLKLFSPFLCNFQGLVPLEISYECRQDLVRADHGVRSMGSCRIEPGPNPFGTKLLTMRSVQTVNSVFSMYPCVVAPRPGLEPGTYGLTENSFFKLCLIYAVCSVFFIDV